MKTPASIALVLLASACGPGVAIDAISTTSAADDDDSTTRASSDSGPATTTTASSTSSSTTGTTSGSSADTTTSATDHGGFIASSDAPQEECDLWVDDCPPGTKCMPWANDNSWSATRCSPIADDPNQVGEPCTVEGSGISGIDDCEKHSMCWDVDPETNMGTCVAMCSGDPSEPICSDPCTSCFIAHDGFIILCLSVCDPLAQDCDEGSACYPTSEEGDFACQPDSSAELGAIGDACEFFSTCDPGLFCGAADRVPNCAGDFGCCTPFCDLGADSPCPDTLAGTECVPWFDDGEASSCIASAIGGCLLPE